eukprot:TRINITY_DN4008_c0_g1_i2.p2 TRINITY_DN4008_c0_g1~~TRINITY_DN4008_c0_g1_i2.p2  ORF type:complete len:196 (-),score=31.68 TRINITY_DN4008_c0_g1_i2:163-750(-)
MKLYTRCTPVACIVSLWAALALDDEQYQHLLRLCSAVIRLTGFMSVWGLFILYNSSKELLKDWNTFKKFVAIKVIILVSILQDKIVHFVLKSRMIESPGCLNWHHGPEFLRTFVNQWLLNFEMVFMAILLIRAFPVDELFEFREEHLENVQIEFKNLSAEESKKANSHRQAGSDAETTASEGSEDGVELPQMESV